MQATRSGAITRYVYDASGNLLCETDSSNNITRYYVHGLGLLAMATPAGGVYTYHYNGIGSTVAMTDQSKQVVNKYFYTAFGVITNQQETVTQPFKYVGQAGVLSEPNGFYYMRARYYDPAIGRFISEDPSGFEGGDVNLYAYVGGNPVSFVDPSGLEAAGAMGMAMLSRYAEVPTGWGIYLHGTDLASIIAESLGIGATGLNWGSYVTSPTAIDYLATGKMALFLNPAEFRQFVSQLRPGVGDWFVLIAAPPKAMEPLPRTPGGAPQWRVRGEHIVFAIYPNPN